MRLINVEALQERLGMANECEGCPNRTAMIFCGLSADLVEVCDAIANAPTIDEIYGFKMDHLATIAKLMQKENIGPKEVATALQDADRVARVIVNELINEQNDMIKRTMEEWKNEVEK